MPHLTVEYSANLSERADIAALCKRLRDAALETGLFEEGAIRVRAICCEHYAIADGLVENAFADLNLRMGAGRSLEDKKRLGEALFGAAEEALHPLFESPHFALSLEIREIDPVLSWKRNAMHQRLRENGSRIVNVKA
ncbi:5-carboxymethyl-2-hydroxymuconate Delta-isomerase [Mesorhizobium sp. RMAD-H1]|uniref:5-carboxymethyl-2-hydroxymuconate Delta-isomerase n=1 Tax=Mesorhizobium sp. RMAD-H1 TaxID=2587065 RepID=UPI00161B7E3D|nr:5-carboxymethyl-2-hydroxymuconate Delta-isomerase [Mesorhizobium sp. RMAD-H1]MBB2971547.1 5-carboxymethyl-2-hydroxymuconate isomerase [Mesorhizobium sp. RMAD-H1]